MKANKEILSLKCCSFCGNRFTISELDDTNDFSSCSIGKSEKNYNLFLTSGGGYEGRPITYIEMLKWNENTQRNGTIGVYVPKYCPECGRYLIENEKYFKINESENT